MSFCMMGAALSGRSLGSGLDKLHFDVATATAAIQAARNMLRFTDNDLLHRRWEFLSSVLPAVLITAAFAL